MCDPELDDVTGAVPAGVGTGGVDPRIEAVKALHKPRRVQVGSTTHGGGPQYGEVCSVCLDGHDGAATYPCATIRALAVPGPVEDPRYIDVVMTVLPGPDGEFVETEDENGHGIGRDRGLEWVDAGDGFHRLRIPASAFAAVPGGTESEAATDAEADALWPDVLANMAEVARGSVVTEPGADVAIEAVRLLHTRKGATASFGGYCAHCRPLVYYPCPTIKALDGDSPYFEAAAAALAATGEETP